MVALIHHPTAGPILYDTGYAERFEAATEPFPERLYRWLTPPQLPAEERLGAQLTQRGIGLDDVERVLVSHLHADHVAGLRDLPRASFLAIEADVAARLGSRWQTLSRGVLPALLPDDFTARLTLVDHRPRIELGADWEPFGSGYDLLGDSSLIGIPLPGHSPAQLGVLLRTEDDREVLLAADSCWSARAFREGLRPSIVARPLFADWAAYRRTLEGLRQVAERRTEIDIIPSHCAASIAKFAGRGHRGPEGGAD